MNIEIEENSRTLIAGKTGSGKTYLATELVKTAPRLIVFDNKNDLADKMALEPESRKNWTAFLRGKPMRLQVKAPLLDSADYADYYDPLFKRVFQGGDCIVYIDELTTVVKNAQSVGQWLGVIYRLGRQAVIKNGKLISGNIGVIASTQRPANIPPFTLTESEHFFCFTLQNPDDRERMADYTTPELETIAPDEHGFYYYNLKDRQSVYVPGL